MFSLTARDLAPAISRGRVTSAAVITAHLERIDAVNPAANAVTSVLAGTVLSEAAAIDRRRAAGEALGPLAMTAGPGPVPPGTDTGQATMARVRDWSGPGSAGLPRCGS